MADVGDNHGGVGGGGGGGGNKKKRKVKRKHSATGAHGGVHLVDDDFDDPSHFDHPLDDEDASLDPLLLQTTLRREGAVIVGDVVQETSSRKLALKGSQELGESLLRKSNLERKDLAMNATTQHQGRDLSPPRRKTQDAAAAAPKQDLSPPRRKTQDAERDLSPPRRKTQDAERDLSPPRRKNQDAERDLSPPRKQPADDDAAPPKIASGLRTAAEVREELAAKRAFEDRRMAQMAESGAGAETVYRDPTTGKRLEGGKAEHVSMLASSDPRRRAAEAEARAKGEDGRGDRPTWASGVRQQQEAEAARTELMAASAQPFARHDMAPSLDQERAAAVRFGDPMAAAAARRAAKRHAAAEAPMTKDTPAAAAAGTSGGFNIPAGVPDHSWRNRGVAPPPNRFNIPPSRFWDGVDRGTGFETHVLARRGGYRK
ncbi:pre-mRNA-splicing factor CWC26 [Pseudoscourfieldia marina]